jgi:conjugative relaxase-like TrwC/TraI family protein
MLFVSHRTNAQEAKDYFTRHMEKSDYYLRDSQEMPGHWHGLGSEMLGLSGTVDKERYFALCDNINPETGASLTPYTKAARRVLYDFTFDAPKSVSLAYELGGDDRVLDAFRNAVKETMSEMEAEVMTRVRSNKRDETRTTSNMVWAEFIHRTARPVTGEDGIALPDPQLHCHAVAFNATYDTEENKWKAGEFSNLVADKGYYQAAFHNRLSGNLKSLGYGIERDGKSFRLAGIDSTIADKFSRRTEIIEAEAARLGVTNAKVKGQLGQRTREAKDPSGMSMPKLQELWKKRLSDSERNAIFKARFEQESTSPDAAASVDYALSHCFERASAVPEKELLKTALIHGVGNASVNDIRAELDRENVRLREKGGIRYATTLEVLNEEIAMSNFVREGRGKRFKLGGIKTPALDPALSDEQRTAALVLLNSRDTVTALKGGAGTGKTRMMSATVKAIEANGKKVFAFAPSADASRGTLRAEGFENAETVERLLIDPKMQETTKGQVLWADEAGLLSVKDMKRLFNVAKQQDARIILTGDTAQHTAVSRGDALRILERDTGMKTAELKDIRRQTNADYRAAVKAISEGDAVGKDGRTRLQAGMEMLDDMGAVIETSGEDRYRKIAAEYAAVTAEKKGRAFKTALVVSPTHKEAERVTGAIREELKEEGRLGTDERQFLSLRPLNMTEAERSDPREYRPRTVLQFQQNAKGFTRGERLTVEGADKDGVRAIRADGSVAIVPLKDAARFQVYEAKQVAVAKGDKLRVTMNGLVERETRRGLLGRKGQKDRLDNGAIFDVDGFTKRGDIRLSNGFVVPKNYGGITHGFVVTSHASQGKTVDVSLVALGSEFFAAATREQAYVSFSRGREALRIYTDDKAEMMSAIRSSAARMSATELMQAAPAKRKPTLTQRLIRSGVIQKAYGAMRERMAAHSKFNHQQPNREGLRLEH